MEYSTSSGDRVGYLVIHPSGEVTAYSWTDEYEVMNLIGGEHRSVDHAQITPELRMAANGVSLLIPEDYEPNETGRRVIAHLAGVPLANVQPLRGSIALYDMDTFGDEWRARPLSKSLRQKVTDAHQRAQQDQGAQQ